MMRNGMTALVTRLTLPDAVGLLVALLLTLAFIFGVISPLKSQSRRASAQLQSIAKERQRYAGVVTSLKRADDSVRQMRATLATSSLHLLSQTSVNQCLADLTGAASDLGLRIKSVQPADPVNEGRFVVVPIQITGRATYPGCTMFIHRVHEIFPDLSVNQFRLLASQEETTNGCDFEMEVRWLTLPGMRNAELPHMASVN